MPRAARRSSPPTIESLDLRRRPTLDLNDRLLIRSRWLAPEDRELIRMHFGAGHSATSLARLRNEPPRRVRTRLRRLAVRMCSMRFELVMRRRRSWPRRRRLVSGAVVLQGRTLRQAQRDLGLTLHQVRREMAVVDAMVASEAQSESTRTTGAAA